MRSGMKMWAVMGGVLLMLCVGVGTGFGETLLFSDDFSGGFGNRWTVGTNTAVNSDVTVSVQEGRVAWTQRYDYIETVQSFDGPFRVEVDLERTLGSNRCMDFVVELVDEAGIAGALRLQYGGITKDTVNLGAGPSLNSNGMGFEGVCVEDETGFMAEMDTVSPHKGTAMLTYDAGKVKFSFINIQGDTVETPLKQIGTLQSPTIRIWSCKSRFVDGVRVYSLGASADNTCDAACTVLNPQNLDLAVPCLIIGGVKYEVDLHFDPAIPNGYYWKLDMGSLKALE